MLLCKAYSPCGPSAQSTGVARSLICDPVKYCTVRSTFLFETVYYLLTLSGCECIPYSTEALCFCKNCNVIPLDLNRPLGLLEFETPRISRHSAPKSCKAIILKHRPPLPTGDIPGTHFCQRVSQHQSHRAAGRIKSKE